MTTNEAMIFLPPEGTLGIRSPVPADAQNVWQMVDEMPDLDSNSPYAYLLLCTHFASTGLVAKAGRDLAGFVLGYVRPDDASTAFVWQVAVAESARGRGLARRLLDSWFDRCAHRSNARFLEATVTPSNAASRALFASFADKRGAPMRERVEFPRILFPDTVSHEDEVAIRIGPVPPSRAVFAPQESS